MSLLISNAAIIDGVADRAVEAQSILIESGRIKAIGKESELPVAAGTLAIDARDKYVISGLMNANVHLFSATTLERLARHADHYELIVAESAQVALKNGLTTVFDTWGPRRFLMAARDRINAGEIPGSRIFCAGNIVGFDGPFSADFHAKSADIASAAFTKRINAIWVENVGRHLMWLSAEEVAQEVRKYINKGIDFLKYASNDHYFASAGAFLAFSSEVQQAIVQETHRAGLTAQAHTMSIEGLRIAVEAGCDLIQHANFTGPVEIPASTLERMAQKKTGAVVFPFVQRQLDAILEKSSDDAQRAMWRSSDVNVRNLIQSGAPILLANDGFITAPERLADPRITKWAKFGADDLLDLASGHFAWLKAMEEKGLPPMQMLKAATRNVAAAYGKDRDLGTIEAGKIADMLILEKNPLLAAENYRTIITIIKDGAIVDTNLLPMHPILTCPLDAPAEEEAAYRATLAADSAFPACPMCNCH